MGFKKKVAPLPVPQSVASITTRLHDTVSDLERHADDQLYLAKSQRAIAADAEAAAAAHETEHELANTVAGNIKTLLGV
jgi:hypothetical protein